MRTRATKQTAMAILVEDSILEAVIRLAMDALAIHWRANGHELTGAFIRKIEPVVRKRARSTDIEVYMPTYGPVRNVGIRPERVPFRRGSGAKRSKFIDGLRRYAMLRMGVSRKEAERVAFAIASKRKKEGFPGSGWMDDATEEISRESAELIGMSVDETLRATIGDFISSQNQN